MRKFNKGTTPDLDYRKAVTKPISIRCIQINEAFEVETLEDVMKGDPGGWLLI